MQVKNETTPRPEVAQAFFAEAHHGPMVMVNLLKFKDKATYPDGRDPDLSGRDAYNRYGAAVVACLEAVGGRVIYSGPVTGIMLGEVDELWDAVALAYYPSPQAMLQMVALPEYQAIEIHRYAGLAGQLNIRTRPAS
ncbi:DUF1330 domain-containing protein [Sandarakinorhabdus rubra]|uniref:DUF1330 domain-containing protein n=1 Tax=Sandarakinorhabdus rubra TaxID=2672568 RepID=UPI0013DA469F|nr:DUF1330 domain-containing protein [Sandarakinorhabdus rubra]